MIRANRPCEKELRIAANQKPPSKLRQQEPIGVLTGFGTPAYGIPVLRLPDFRITGSGISASGESQCQVFLAFGIPALYTREMGTICRNNRKGGIASLRSRKCVKRNAVFGARFKGLSL